MTETQEKITRVFNSLRDVVLEKIRWYGDAALTLRKVFSRLEAEEGLLVRIDDKLGRIANNQGEMRKNDVADLMGYLALLAVARGWLDFADLVD